VIFNLKSAVLTNTGEFPFHPSVLCAWCT